jgi:hypothetical protein
MQESDQGQYFDQGRASEKHNISTKVASMKFTKPTYVGWSMKVEF